MPYLLHHTTTTTLQRRKRLIKTIHLIILVFHSIQVLICYQFHLGNLHTLMEKTTLSRVIKCVVIYFSLHPSIWEIVENGMYFDSTNNLVFINEQIHKNVQATTVLLASLCRDEYNKVSGLDNAKQI
jgi:DNA integrity scanning protein DisA with diadenylate cyclase activity